MFCLYILEISAISVHIVVKLFADIFFWTIGKSIKKLFYNCPIFVPILKFLAAKLKVQKYLG